MSFFWVTGNDYGYLSEMQLQWLEKDLAFVPKQRPLVIFLHIPSISNVVQFNPGRDPNRESLINKAALYNLLYGYEVHLMSGHVHWNENNIKGNIFEHNHGAISGAWWSGPICYDGSPKGYGVYKMNKKLSWYYKSVGKEWDHQFRVYKPGEHPDFPGEYCINIWNWDPYWKVSWYEDDRLSGNPEQRIALDPIAISKYSNNGTPKKHSWVVPQNNGHMFFFKPKTPSSRIKVEVVDRFKNVYILELQ